MVKTWLITGCSSGLGRAIAVAALDRGDQVVVTARKLESLGELVAKYGERALAAKLDITQAGDAQAAVAAAVERFGGLDVLVNNAGIGMIGAVEEASPEEYRTVFETNVFGTIETTRAALPVMRGQRSGRILNISSIAGIMGRAGFGYYNATKFSIVGMSEALAADVAPLGIRVTVVEPGMFHTRFLRSNVIAKTEIEDYAKSAGTARRFDPKTASVHKPGDPRRAAAVLLTIVDSEDPPLHLPLGPDAYERIHAKLRGMDAQISEWEEIASDVAYLGDRTHLMESGRTVR